MERERSPVRSDGEPWVGPALDLVAPAVGACAVLVGGAVLVGWALDIALLKSVLPGWVSMKPNAALAFILAGTALLFSRPVATTLDAPHATMRGRVARVCGLLAGLIGLLTLAEFVFGWSPGFDQWLFPEPAGTVGTSNPGRMAPDSALCFVLLAAGVEIIRRPRRATRSMAAVILLGILVSTMALIEILSYFTPTLRTYGWAGLTMMALPTAVVFLALGTALIAVAVQGISSTHEQSASPADALLDPVGLRYLQIFGLLAAGIFAVGTFYYRSNEQNFRVDIGRQLSSIADLKVSQLVQWRHERLSDGGVLFRNPPFARLARRLSTRPTDDSARRELLNWLGSYTTMYGYNQLRLLDADGATLLSSGDAAAPLSAVTRRASAEALRSGNILFQDFYRSEHDRRIYLQAVVPLFDGPDARRPVGAVVLRIDPRDYLYPFIQQWPLPSRSGETLLARRDGSDVVFLNDLRFTRDAALALRLPLSRREVPAARAVLGDTGTVEGLDYRGTLVVAAMRRVPDSPWFLIAKMDVAEAYAPIRDRLWQVVLLVSALLLGAGGGVGLLWFRERQRTHRERIAVGQDLDKLAAIVDTSEDSIIGKDLDGVVLTWNRGAEKCFGYRAAEMVGQSIRLVFPPEEADELPRILETVRRGESIGEHEAVRVRKDGQRLTMSLSLSPLRGADGAVVGALVIGRDITERQRSLAALRENAARYQSILATAMEGFWMIDAHARLLDVNEAYVRMSGYSVADLLRMRVADLEAAEAVPAISERIRRVLETGGDRFETRHRRKDGTVFDVEVSVQVLPDGDGRMVGFLRDITDAKRAAAEREERAEVFNASQRVGRIGSYELDFARAQFQASDVLEELFGIEHRAWHPLSDWADLLHPSDAERMVRYLSQTVRAERRPFDQEYRIVDTRDGAVRWMHGLGELRSDSTGEPVTMIGTIQDVTAHRAAEDALRDSESRWKFAIEGAGDGLFDWYVPAGRAFFSDQWKAQLGYAGAEIGSGLDEWQGRVHPDDLPRVMADVSALLDGATPSYQSEFRMRRKDGGWVWILARGTALSRDAAGRALRVIGTHTDITSHRRDEQMLRLERGALEAAANAIVITDQAGLIVWANAAFTAFTGYGLDEAIGRRPGDLIRSGVHDRAFFEQLWTTILAGGVWSGEIVNQRKDGTRYTEDMTITPLKDARGVITHFVGVKQDITQRKLLEEQFRQSHKMESVGRLAGGIAHDFNNMLAVILGRTELALRQADTALPLHAHLKEIEQAAKRSAGLTRQLLAFARREVITPRPLDLNESIGEELKMLRRLIGEHISVEWKPAPSSWQVLMDASQLDQILANLCVNARDAIGAGGTLTIAVKNVVADASVSLRFADAEPGEYVSLSVTDTGGGMTKEVQVHLFEPFFTTKATGQGTGLGLSTVYGAVTQNRGHIRVASEPGRGTTFEILFPRYTAAPVETAQADAPAPRAKPGHETILLVEDEALVLELTGTVLDEAGYVVLRANGPDEAIDLAAVHVGAIDLLVTDVVMPKMNGRELATALTSRVPHLKVLFMSGYTAGVPGLTEATSDAAHFLAKPFTIDELLTKVREVLNASEVPWAGTSVHSG